MIWCSVQDITGSRPQRPGLYLVRGTPHASYGLVGSAAARRILGIVVVRVGPRGGMRPLHWLANGCRMLCCKTEDDWEWARLVTASEGEKEETT